MKPFGEILADKRLELDPRFPIVRNDKKGLFSGSGWIRVQKNKSAKMASVMWGSNEYGWEHVSVSFKERTPTWDEMCVVKDVFWTEDETCIQYHPARREYVNMVEHCLHIWRKVGAPSGWPLLTDKEERHDSDS